MDHTDLEKLGLNRNEAKVYYGLLRKNKATAMELVKILGVHRNIVYDNLEKLIDKGLVSFVEEKGKRIFFAEDQESIVNFLKSEKDEIDDKIKTAEGLSKEIRDLLKVNEQISDVKVFRGVLGLKKVLKKVLDYPENWSIGISTASEKIIDDVFWGNYNSKVKSRKIKQHLLFNADFEDNYGIDKQKYTEYRILPPNLIQVTEIILFGDKVAIFIYSETPVALLISSSSLFESFMVQFKFLWQLSKKK